MSSFDEYRKKLNDKYSNTSTDTKANNSGGRRGGRSTADGMEGKDYNPTPKSFEDIRNKMQDRYSDYSAESKEGWQKYLDDQEARKGTQTKKKDETFWEKLGRWMGEGGAVDTSIPLAEMPQIIRDISKESSTSARPSDEWTYAQKYAFGELYLSDPEKAYRYAEETNNAINKAKEEAKIESIQESATDNFWAGAAHTAGAILTAPLGLADFLQDLAYANAGREIAPDGNITPFEYSQAVTGGISTHLNEEGGVIDERVPIIGGKGWGDVYGLGTSIAQSALSGYTLGGAGTLISYFGSAAASGVDDALSRGASEEQAILYGTALGVFEGLAEQIGIDNLFKIGSSKTTRELIKNILRQAGAEGLEEGLTSILGNIADNVIMQDKSNFYAMVQAYMSQGMTEKEAMGQAWSDSVEGIAFDTLGGFVSGGVHAGVHTGALSALSNYKASRKYGDQSQQIIDEALSMGDDSESKALGEKYKGRVEGGKNLKGSQINRMLEAFDADIATEDTSKVLTAVEARLTELGETGDVGGLAGAIYSQVMGEELSRSEKNLIKNSKFGERVANELDPINIASGEYSSSWAENIGTKRLNPESYNKQLYDLARDVSGVREAKEQIAVAKNKADFESATGTKFTATESGKTTHEDAEVTIGKVVSTEGGLKVELSNGKTVNANEIEYGSGAEAMMYEMVARMEVSADTANEILSTFKPTTAKQATMYFNNIPLAYKYGTINYEAGLKNINMSEQEKRIAFNRGKMDAVGKAKANTKTASPESAKTASAKQNGIIFEDGFTYDESKANELQKVSMAHIEVIEKISNLEVHVFESKVEDGKRVAYVNGKKVSAPNGYFTDGNKIYIDFYAGHKAEGAMLYTMSHEVTHYIRKWNEQGFKELGDFLIEQYGKNKVSVTELIENQKDKIKARYKRENKALPSDAKLFDMAYEELVADAMSDMFADPRAYEKLAKLKAQNKTLWEKVGEAIKALLDKLKSALGIYKTEQDKIAVTQETHEVRAFSKEVYEKLQDLYIKAFVQADANYEAFGGEATDLDGNENEHLFSDKSMVEGAGLQFILNEDGVSYKVLDQNGEPVKSVTADMIVDSPLGNLVTMAKNEGFLGKGKEATIAARKQYEFLAELVNMCINYNGIAPIWETAGTMVFSSMKSNADKQYGLTVDFSTVCKKTQAVVDAMSEAMLRLGRGLTRSEVETIYLEVGKAGESTPCPVCYVFSRWMGIGGILDQISRFQDKYSAMSEKSLQKFIADIQEKIEETANTPGKNGKLKSKFFNAKGEISEGQVIAELKSKASSKAASALKAIATNSDTQLEIQELEALMKTQDSKGAKKTADKIKKLKNKLKDVSALEQEMRDADDTLEEYEAYQWLTRTMMMESGGKWIKNSAFKPVPKDILFDLNKGDKFAEGYPLTWAFRTGKGASAGKAIVPYADARVGEAIQAVASQSPTDIKIGLELNPFLNSNTADRLKILKSAIAKQARQNLVGGQRYQSTSDFRYEYGSDYLITFLEMQAIGAKVQLYTKVIEAVDFLASMGADCNLSVMPLSDGFITLPDGTKKLVYSSVTGINAEAAIQKSHEYNNVQLILVGISDEHIRLALEGTDVTFVIPFHGSGNSVHQIQALMNLLGENLDVTTAQDYTLVQSDHVSPNQTKEQKAMWNLRVKIIKGEAFPISVAEQALLDKNSYLSDLYRRFYLDKKAEEYGVGLTSGQAEQIFPYEYWDKSLTYAEADQNGERFKEYCASMGIIPRFSGMNSKGEYLGFGDFTNDKGYWKLLIDRPMYDNTYDSDGNWTGYGKYHEQARINCSNFNVKHLDPEYGSATYGEVMSKANDPKKTNKIVDAALKQFENNTLNDVRLSDRDSEGNILTAEQQEFFKDSKVRDADGNLFVVYHGSPSKFTEFKHSKIGGHGTSLGKGFYFTEDSNLASGFYKEGGQLLKGYLDIKKPLVDGKKTIKKAELEKLIRAICKVEAQYIVDVDGGYNTIEEALRDTFISNYVNTYEMPLASAYRKVTELVYSDCDNDSDIIGELINAGGGASRVLGQVRKVLGYDGVIFEHPDGVHEFVAFESNQFKDTTNKTPTSDPDIRYSDRDTDYMDAVKRGDMKTAQRMVDEAAKAEGYTIKAYHGTNVKFTAFNTGAKHGWLGRGIYFTDNKQYARKNGKIVMSVFLDSEKIYSSSETDHYGVYAELKEKFPRIDEFNIAEVAKEEGYTGIEYTDWDKGKIICVFDPEQIKSADPVTYDDNGNVIPLSERFNSENNDIRYSDRDPNAVSNRTLLAGALESVAQNDIEKTKLAQYKSKIELIESEQAKLEEIKAKANEIRFTKGRTSAETKHLRDLDAEANQIANRISTYDKQLLNLESTKALKNVLEREKTMLRRRLEQKGKEALRAQKEQNAKTVREIMTRNTESRLKNIEGRHKTEMRNKIKDVVGKLNTLLLNPTKEQHVPIGLQLPVAEALDAINMDSMNAAERVAYYNDLIAKSSNPDEIEMLTKKRDFFEYRDANFKERITALKNAYAEFKESDDPLIRNAHNEAIEDLIKNTADAVGNKSLKDMSLAQLEAVHNMYKAILATVRNSNKLFKEGRQETITDNSEAVKTEVKEVGGHQEKVLKSAKFFKKFGWDMLKPVTAMKAIGSKTFEKLFNNVRAAEDTWAVDVNEAKQFYEGASDKYGFKKWDFKKRYSFKDSTGTEFSLSLEQIMSLYAYSKREQADKHLELGGFIFDDAIEVTEKGKLGIPLKYEVNDANPYRLRKEDLLNVTEALTKEQKAFIDEMQTYLSEVMGAKGNEVSLAMYDIKLYNETNYFPLKTSRYFREFDPEKSGTPKIKNAGFSKKTVPQAGNPIVLANFMDVWASHVNEMSMYHAFVLPLEDFMRVYNYSSTAGGYDSVQQYIKNAYGSQANQYIEKLLDDLNGGARVDSSAGVINKGLSLFKKASVFASASVVVQQPSAIARAMAYINPKYFGTSVGSALNLKKHKAVWAEVKKYAPVAVIKEMGYFDTGVGRSTVEWLKGNKTFKDKMDDVLSKAPAIADELTWCHIWAAVKKETEAKGQFKVGTEEFLKESGRRFTEVITNTQVYDSVLSRSGMMRSKDTGMKMATAFMAEPTTTVNMMVDGIIQGKRGNKKFTAKTVGAISASIILNSILVALVYAARDDDEDETYTEKYIGSLTTELLDGFNPLTYVPFVKDIWSIAQGYDVERSDMSVVSNLWESVEGLFNENKSGWEKVADTSGAISSLFGIPLKNILRDAKGMYNLTKTILSDTKTTKGGVGSSIEDSFKSSIPLWDRVVGTDSKSDNIYKAIVSGDTAYAERLKKTYKTTEAYETAVRKALRENDSRIGEAAQARLDGDLTTYTRIAKEIIAEGNFSQDIVVGAINAEMSAIKKGESSGSETTEDKDEVTSIYSASDINAAFANGNDAVALEIINDLINTKVANGMEEKDAKSSVKSSMTSYWKPLYIEAYKSGDNTEMLKIRRILLASGLYGGASDVVKTVRNWLKS